MKKTTILKVIAVLLTVIVVFTSMTYGVKARANINEDANISISRLSFEFNKALVEKIYVYGQLAVSNEFDNRIRIRKNGTLKIMSHLLVTLIA